MSTPVTDFRDAVDHLPVGGMLVFDDVSWEDYEHFLNEIEDRPGLRVTYDEGRMRDRFDKRIH